MPFEYRDITTIAYQLLKAPTISLRVNELAKQLDKDPREEVSLFWIANGALPFVMLMWRAAGLFTRKQLLIETVAARTYGADLQPQIIKEDAHGIDFSIHRGRRKILLEDLIVTGGTLNAITSVVAGALPGDAELEIVTLFQKRDCLEYPVRLALSGFSLTGDPWLIGVGLDHFSYYRTQPGLWMLKKEFLPKEYPQHKRDIYPEHPSDVKITVDDVPVAEWYMCAHQTNGNGGNGH